MVKNIVLTVKKSYTSGVYNCNFEVNKLENEKIKNGI